MFKPAGKQHHREYNKKPTHAYEDSPKRVKEYVRLKLISDNGFLPNEQKLFDSVNNKAQSVKKPAEMQWCAL